MKRWISRVASDWRQLKKNKNIPANRSKVILFADYLYWVLKNHISYSEYFDQYKFYTLTRKERDEYITVSQAHLIESKLNQKVRDIFWHKDEFLKRFPEFANRSWISFDSASPEEFFQFYQAHPQFIIKPVADTRGTGVELVSNIDINSMTRLYNRLSGKNYIAEEYIVACDELSSFNPDSLNTIRVVTYLNGNVFRVVGSFIRMGLPGSRVDNAHAGGIFAYIDVETGIVNSDGINTSGERFLLHPGSQKQIRGFQIPDWNRIVETCRRAAMAIPEAKIVGWDVAVTKDYRVMIIEGNHMPDFDLMQSPRPKGIKKELMDIIGDAS